MRQKRAKMSPSTLKVTHGWLSTEHLLHSSPPFSRDSATNYTYAWLPGLVTAQTNDKTSLYIRFIIQFIYCLKSQNHLLVMTNHSCFFPLFYIIRFNLRYFKMSPWNLWWKFFYCYFLKVNKQKVVDDSGSWQPLNTPSDRCCSSASFLSPLSAKL